MAAPLRLRATPRTVTTPKVLGCVTDRCCAPDRRARAPMLGDRRARAKAQGTART